MKIEHKKLIAREILWFVVPFICLIALVFWASKGAFPLHPVMWNWRWFLTALVTLYFLRAVAWAVKTLFFKKK